MEIQSGKPSLPTIRTAMRMSRKTVKQPRSEKPLDFNNVGEEGSGRRIDKSDNKGNSVYPSIFHSSTGPKLTVASPSPSPKHFPIPEFLSSPETMPHLGQNKNPQQTHSIDPWIREKAPLEVVGNTFLQFSNKNRVTIIEAASPGHENKGKEGPSAHVSVRQSDRKRTQLKKKTGIFHQSPVNSLIQGETSHVSEVESLLLSEQIRALSFKKKAKETNRGKYSHPTIKISIPSEKAGQHQSSEATSPHLLHHPTSIPVLPAIRYTHIESQELDSSSGSDVEKVLEQMRVNRTPKQRPISKREETHATEPVPISHAALVTEYNLLTAKVMTSTISVARRRSKLNGVSGRLLKH